MSYLCPFTVDEVVKIYIIIKNIEREKCSERERHPLNLRERIGLIDIILLLINNPMKDGSFRGSAEAGS